jgi:phospholipid/cholesterol/gamma-HCH transport system substrate-binding protein
VSTHIDWRRLAPAIAGLILAIVMILAMNASFGGPGSTPSGYELQVRLADTKNLVKKSRVMIRGIRVGEVTAVEADRTGADVTVLIDDRYAPLPAGTRLRIGYRTVFAEPYIDVVAGPAGGEDLPAGASVPPAAVTGPDETLALLDLRARERLGNVSKEVARGLRDERSAERIAAWIDGLTATTAEVRAVTAALRGQGDAIAALMNDSAIVLRTTSRHEADLRRIVTSGRTVSETMAGLAPELERTISAFAGLTGDAEGALVAAAPLLAEAAPVVQRLVQDTADLRAATGQSAPVTRQARTLLVDDVPATARAVRPVLSAAGRFARAFEPLARLMPTTLANVVPIARYLGDYGVDIGTSLATISDTVSTGDDEGAWVRLFMPMDLDLLLGLDAPCEPVSGGLCSNPYPKPGHALDPQPYERGSYPRLAPFTPSP